MEKECTNCGTVSDVYYTDAVDVDGEALTYCGRCTDGATDCDCTACAAIWEAFCGTTEETRRIEVAREIEKLRADYEARSTKLTNYLWQLCGSDKETYYRVTQEAKA